MGIAVGIDLGTTNSCMAVVQGERAKVIEDQDERRIHPSVVSYFPDGSNIAGHPAKERQIIDPASTVYSFKRLLGRDVRSPDMQKAVSKLPYTVQVGAGDVTTLKVHGREITLPEVSAMMLRHLRELFEEMYQLPIGEAVITVPANFNDVQRASTKVAGRIAGFNVLRILNEPTAAALAYGFGGEHTERIAIYDYGGGTFDITIVEIADDIFEVLSTAGDTFLGGDDFDHCIINKMIDDFKQEHHIDLSDDPVAYQRIRSVAEQIKCQLSFLDDVQASLREIIRAPNGDLLDFHFRLNQREFETLTEPLVQKSLTVCDEALKLAGLHRGALDNLVFVGGTTRVPLVRKRVAEYFGLEPRTEINPDEVVAVGAAIQAFSLTGESLPADIQPRNLSSIPAPAYSQTQTSAPPPIPLPTSSAPHSVPPPVPEAAATPRTTPLPLPLEPEEEESSTKVNPLIPGLTTDTDLEAALPQERIPLATEEQIPVIELETDSDLDLEPRSELDHDALFGNVEFDIPDADIAPLVKENYKREESSDAIPAVLGTPSMEESLPAAAEEEVFIDIPVRVSPTPPPPPAPFQVAQEEPISFPLPADQDPPGTLDEDFGNIHVPLPGAENDRIVPMAVPVAKEQPRQPTQQSSFKLPKSAAARPALLLDVTPRALGVATAGGFCDTIIERNAAIPVEQSRLFTTSSDDQTEVSIDVYQGESRRTADNTQLGKVVLSELRPAPRGEIKIRVTFEIDTDGILGISARNEETGEAEFTRITLTGGIDEEQVEALVQKYSNK